MDNNIYTQIGMVLIIALASKNAILIVEFARELRLAGRSIREAAVGGRADAVPADHHDELRVHPRRAAAGVRDRRRGGEPAVARHRGVRRDDHRDRAGGVLRAGVLRRDPVADRVEERPAETAARRGIHAPHEAEPPDATDQPAEPTPPLPLPVSVVPPSAVPPQPNGPDGPPAETKKPPARPGESKPK